MALISLVLCLLLSCEDGGSSNPLEGSWKGTHEDGWEFYMIFEGDEMQMSVHKNTWTTPLQYETYEVEVTEDYVIMTIDNVEVSVSYNKISTSQFILYQAFQIDENKVDITFTKQ